MTAKVGWICNPGVFDTARDVLVAAASWREQDLDALRAARLALLDRNPDDVAAAAAWVVGSLIDFIVEASEHTIVPADLLVPLARKLADDEVKAQAR